MAAGNRLRWRRCSSRRRRPVPCLRPNVPGALGRDRFAAPRSSASRPPGLARSCRWGSSTRRRTRFFTPAALCCSCSSPMHGRRSTAPMGWMIRVRGDTQTQAALTLISTSGWCSIDDLQPGRYRLALLYKFLPQHWHTASLRDHHHELRAAVNVRAFRPRRGAAPHRGADRADRTGNGHQERRPASELDPACGGHQIRSQPGRLQGFQLGLELELGLPDHHPRPLHRPVHRHRPGVCERNPERPLLHLLQ